MLKNHTDNEQEVTEIDILTKDNHIKTALWISSRILDEEGKNITATISQDITSRKRTEDALILSEARYRCLFESAKDGILILDAETGKIVGVNPFLIDLLGYSKEECIEKSIWEIGSFMDIYENKEKFLELQHEEYVRYDDLPLVTSDGQRIHVEFVSIVYLANHVKVIQCNIRDITERKQAEKELIEAKEGAEESDRLKTAFLHNVSHEIRTPMNAIVGFSGFLNNPGLIPEKRKHFTDIIIHSSEQLLAIIDDIIRIASIEAGQEKIFNRFRQVETTDKRDFGGSGLGLSISKAYIKMLGGNMWLTSELDKGSVFYFTIPCKNTNLKKLSVPPSIKELNLELDTTKTILITEDKDSDFMLLEEMLSDFGINIIRAVNGLEAIEFCRSNPHIDLVLMDIKMPEMDGYHATTLIKEFRPDLPIIAQTAYTTEANRMKAMACGCSDSISKPINKTLLLSKIYEQLHK